MTGVLIVEDDLPLQRALRLTFTAHGYEITTVAEGAAALRMVATRKPDLVVLDLGLPDVDGEEVIAALRGWSAVPIVVLSARLDSLDKVRALDAGADDYVTKPFEMDELLARLRAAARRTVSRDVPGEPVVGTDEFAVDLAGKTVWRGGEQVRLTPTEWSVLEVLVRNRGRMVSQHQLLTDVWGSAYATEKHYLRVYLAQLRRKLEPEPHRPRHLITHPGMGYRFEGGAESASAP